MSELKDLLDKPAHECSDEELEKRRHLLSKLRIAPKKKSSSSKPRKTNKQRQVEDLLKGLSKEDLEKLKAKLQEGGSI
jgi:ATP-dependent DNA ligase